MCFQIFHIFETNFSRDFLTDQCIQNLKKVLLGLLAHVTPFTFKMRLSYENEFYLHGNENDFHIIKG